MHARTNSVPTARCGVALVATVLALVAIVSPAGAFSTGSPVCELTSQEMAANMLTPLNVGTGGFVVDVLRAGTPVTNIVPGETLQIRVTRPANTIQKGIQIWVKNAQGTRIGTFTAGTGTHLVAGCGATTITQSSNISVTSRTVTWTAPSDASGTLTVSTLVVAGTRADWYGPLTTTLTAAPPAPVPSLQTWALALGGLALVATAYRRLRSAIA